MEQSETVSRPIDAAILHEIGQAKIDSAPLPTRAERLDEWESWGYDRRELSRLFPDTHVFRIATQVIAEHLIEAQSWSLTPEQDAADRAILVAMGCSRDPDDCDMEWYRQQYARKLAG
jgi:hypothetical protein